MALDLGTIGGAITLDGSQYFSTMGKVDSVSQSTMSNVKKYVADAVTVYGSYRLAKAAAFASMDFEKEVSSIRSLGQEFSKAQLSRELMNINSELGRAQEMAAATYFAYSAGIRGTEQEMAAFTSQIAGTNKAVRGELVPTMNAMTSVMKAYNIAINDASKAGDWYFTIIKQGKTTGSELATSLGQVIGNANMSGVALEQLGAGIASLTTIMPTAQAITGLNQVINGFIKPTAQAKAFAKEYGIELSAAALKAKGFAGALEEIRQKVGTDPDKIAKMFTSVEAIKALAPLLGSLNKEFNANVTEFENNAGAMNKALTEQLDNTAAKWSTAMSDINKAMIVTGDAMKPFTDTAATVVSAFGQLVQNAPPAAVQIGVVGAAVAIIQSRLAPLIKDLVMIPSNLAAVSASLKGNTTSIGAETAAWTANTTAIRANNLARAGRNAGMMAASGMSMMDHNEAAFQSQFTSLRDRQHQANRYNQARRKVQLAQGEHYQNWLYSGKDGEYVPLRDRNITRNIAGNGNLNASAGDVGKLTGAITKLGSGAANTAKMLLGNAGLVMAVGAAGFALGDWIGKKTGLHDAISGKKELDAAEASAAGIDADVKRGYDDLNKATEKRLELLIQEKKISEGSAEQAREALKNGDRGRAIAIIRDIEENGDGNAQDRERRLRQDEATAKRNKEYRENADKRENGWNYAYDQATNSDKYGMLDGKIAQEYQLMAMATSRKDEDEVKKHEQKIYDLMRERKRLEVALNDDALSEFERKQKLAYNRFLAQAAAAGENEYLLKKRTNEKQIENLKARIRAIEKLEAQAMSPEQKKARESQLAEAQAELAEMLRQQKAGNKDMNKQYQDKSYSYASGILGDNTMTTDEKTKAILEGADAKAKALYDKIFKEESARIGTHDEKGKIWSQAATLERLAKELEKQNRASNRKEEVSELKKINQTLGKSTTIIWTLPNS